jgi:hypothetical protein
MISKIISGAIAIAYLFWAYQTADGETTFRVGLFLILPLACIWFSSAMGDYTGFNFGALPPITQTTPGCFVAFGGWLLLLLPIIFLLIVSFS